MAAAGAVPPAPGLLRSSVAVAGHHWLLYRRTLRSSLFGNFASPALFLVAMGIGLGAYVDRGGGADAALGGIAYLQFLAPALLVATVMQGQVFEATFPVIAGFHWARRFHAMHATPVTPAAVALGLVLFNGLHASLVGGIFAFVALLLGAAVTPGLLLVVPVATLTALAFGTPIAAYMATQRNTVTFNSIWRFGITPLFLFSGTFFPVERLPEVLQPAAWLLPLWHGVDLARALALGSAAADPLRHLAHVVVLTGLAAAGLVLMLRTFRRQLEGAR